MNGSKKGCFISSCITLFLFVVFGAIAFGTGTAINNVDSAGEAIVLIFTVPLTLMFYIGAWGVGIPTIITSAFTLKSDVTAIKVIGTIILVLSVALFVTLTAAFFIQLKIFG